MKKSLLITLFTLIVISCNENQNSELTINSNDLSWIAIQNAPFGKEFIICNSNVESEIMLTTKLSEKDKITRIDGNRFLYTSEPQKSGSFLIKGYISDKNGNRSEFQQKVYVEPDINPISYNKNTARKLLLNVDNEIMILAPGIPSSHLRVSSENAELRNLKGGSFLIKPTEIGICVVKVEAYFPGNNKVELGQIQYTVGE